MTLEELDGCNNTDKKMETVHQALEELLAAAQRQECLTVGVYESAKLMNVDPDSVVLCVLATDEEDEGDIALQIHFTLIQAFCCDNDINILRVSGLRRLEQVLCTEGGPTGTTTAGGVPIITTSTTTTISSSTMENNTTNNNNLHPAAAEPRDLHCILVTNPQCSALDSQQALQRVGNYCEERRGQDQWVPYLSLQER